MITDFERKKRIYAVNSVLTSFTNVMLSYHRKGTLGAKRTGIKVHWLHWSGEMMSRYWVTRGNDFYPVWHNKLARGGTFCTALSQLVRWCQDQPIFGIYPTWQYWAGQSVKLLPMRAVDQLLSLGYPADTFCVLCRRTIDGGVDWWSLDGVTGPCCHWTSGCQQKGQEATP